jgi:hypothetical protein
MPWVNGKCNSAFGRNNDKKLEVPAKEQAFIDGAVSRNA